MRYYRTIGCRFNENFCWKGVRYGCSSAFSQIATDSRQNCSTNRPSDTYSVALSQIQARFYTVPALYHLDRPEVPANRLQGCGFLPETSPGTVPSCSHGKYSLNRVPDTSLDFQLDDSFIDFSKERTFILKISFELYVFYRAV